MTAMAGTRWIGRRRALVVATFTLACAAFLSVTAPKAVSIAELSSEWECRKMAFVLTTCTQVRPFNGTVQNPGAK
jgi:hypothetical protein